MKTGSKLTASYLHVVSSLVIDNITSTKDCSEIKSQIAWRWLVEQNVFGKLKKDFNDNQYYLDYILTKIALYTPKGENPTTNEQDDKLYRNITTL